MAVLEIFITIGSILIGVIIIGYLISIYNVFIRLKNNIEKAWSNIDVLLKQRHDELPNLIETIKGYAKHEKRVFTEVAKARTAFLNAKTLNEKAKASDELSATLKSLFAVAENYPQLKANENFMQLQNRISTLETQIADRREFYNDSVNIYNTRLEQIPYVFVGRMLEYTRKELFSATEDERKKINVRFQ